VGVYMSKLEKYQDGMIKIDRYFVLSVIFPEQSLRLLLTKFYGLDLAQASLFLFHALEVASSSPYLRRAPFVPCPRKRYGCPYLRRPAALASLDSTTTMVCKCECVCTFLVFSVLRYGAAARVAYGMPYWLCRGGTNE
jgi:hypothetical protein